MQSQPYTTELVASPDATWDQAVASFRDSNMMQSVAYAGARWGQKRLSGVLLRDGAGRVASACLAVVAKAPLLPVGVAVVKYGPLWRPGGREAEASALDAALHALRREFVERRQLLLRIVPCVDPEDGGVPLARLAAAGFTHTRAIPDPERYLVRLNMGDADMLASLAANWRRNLRKSERQGMEAGELAGPQALEIFLGLYGAMLKRKRFSDHHGVHALESMLRASSGGVATRVFAARSGGEVVAATVLSGSGDVVSVPFSATSDKALEMKAGYFLRWHVMRRLREAGARWLDLGGTEGDEGLRSFKTGNVGKAGLILPLAGDFDDCRNPLSRVAAACAEIARQFLPRPGVEARPA